MVTKGLAEEIHEDKEFTRLGTLRKLSRQEIDSNYVRKPLSKTPRMQFIFNSSLKCPKSGLNSKEMMTKRMNVLGNVWELLRFMGNSDKATRKRDSTQKKGDKVNKQLQLLDGAVLRPRWSRERDVFVIQPAINVSPRKRKQPTGEDMTLKDFYKLEGVSVANSFYDPRGMISPLPIILKVMLRSVLQEVHLELGR